MVEIYHMMYKQSMARYPSLIEVREEQASACQGMYLVPRKAATWLHV
jgi:hypothetical protein